MTPEAVEAWLRENPGFLAERPALYAALHPPRRHHGPPLADHMAAMIAEGRRETARVLDASRARQALAARVGEAVIALLRAPCALDCMAEEWPALLAMDSVRLLAAGPPGRHLSPLPAGAAAPPGGVLVRPVAHPAWHGEAAGLVVREALVALRPGALLLLGAREARLLPAQPAPLAFLGRALAARLKG
ncbi:hypothetical protein ACI6QG_14255 [Roseococcus sp. DSY-14]|uniref:hypothetical protein n=1 Tax=Roseococcus sp. DSY-14 TaxID=3369650 RepID=UPI00387B6211